MHLHVLSCVCVCVVPLFLLPANDVSDIRRFALVASDSVMTDTAHMMATVVVAIIISLVLELLDPSTASENSWSLKMGYTALLVLVISGVTFDLEFGLQICNGFTAALAFTASQRTTWSLQSQRVVSMGAFFVTIALMSIMTTLYGPVALTMCLMVTAGILILHAELGPFKLLPLVHVSLASTIVWSLLYSKLRSARANS